jgi:23S rRNA (uracil1939-C5)-methyltransferase
MPVRDDELILRVAAKGDGVTADGRHAAFAAPGDRLLADNSIVPGPHHQVPPCRHFPECGGCQLQHLDDESWSRFLVERIETALAAQGLGTEIRPPLLSPPRTRRRATLHAERRGGQVLLGFTEGASHRLIDLRECWVLDPRLFALVAPLRGLLAVLLPKSRRVDVHLALIDQGVDVLLQGVEEKGLASAEGITSFARRHQLARLSIDDGFGPQARWEPEPATVTFGGLAVPFPAASFLQATPEGEAALIAAVREAVGPARTIADLFTGLGTFALSLGPPARVYAAESARDPLMALKAAVGFAQRQLFADHRDLFRRPLTTEELNRFDAVVLDPPRAGAREQTPALAASTVKKVAYVSCSPATFARDVQLLCEGGYGLDWVQPIGQFRWSTHVELAARLSRP